MKGYGGERKKMKKPRNVSNPPPTKKSGKRKTREQRIALAEDALGDTEF